MTHSRVLAPCAKQPEVPDELINLMQLQLSWLKYGALLICAERLLISLGYREVSPLSRTFLRGRTDHAGIDLVAKQQTALARFPVLIQLRHRKQRISRSEILCLSGALNYYMAANAVVLTTSIFAKPARETARILKSQVIRLIDGREFARLMIDHRIGVRDVMNPKTGARSLEFSPEHFEALERIASTRSKGGSDWGLA